MILRVLVLLLVVLTGCSAQPHPGVSPSSSDLTQHVGAAKEAGVPMPHNFSGSMICKIKVSGTGYSHTETQTWEITGPPAGVPDGAELVFPALWSATGNGSASTRTGSTQWDAQWTVKASKAVRLFIQPISGPDRWRFGHWSAQALQHDGVTGSQTLKTVGMRTQTSAISQTAFEATLGATQYLPRDATNVVTGKVTTTQPAVGNLGLGVPRDARFNAEWTWRFTPESTGPPDPAKSADCEKKFTETHVYSTAPEAVQKFKIDKEILGGDFCKGAAIDMHNEAYVKQLIGKGEPKITVQTSAKGLQFFIVKGGGEGFLPDSHRGIDASDVTRGSMRFDDNDLIAVFDEHGKLLSSALLQRPFSVPGKITRRTADKVYGAWHNRPVSLYKNNNFEIKYWGLAVDDSLGEYRSGRVRIDIHKQEDTNGCIFIVDENTPPTSKLAELNAFEPKLIMDVMNTAGVKNNIGIMHMLTIE
jgi:hypothetical protein